MVEIGSFQCSTLTAQPFGYEESETRFGLTAKKWSVQGLIDPVAWIDLLTEYDAWREARIEDEDTETSGVVGTTVEFSATGPGGQSWTADCWFISAPAGEQSGAKIAVSFEVVDAAEALQVLLKQQESESAADADQPDLGNYVLGGATIKLLRPIDAYRQAPEVQLSSTGNHYINGPLAVERVKNIEGTTNEAGWNSVRAWYEAQLVQLGSTGDLFPITVPEATAAAKIVNGIKTTEYTVSIQLLELI